MSSCSMQRDDGDQDRFGQVAGAVAADIGPVREATAADPTVFVNQAGAQNAEWNRAVGRVGWAAG